MMDPPHAVSRRGLGRRAALTMVALPVVGGVAGALASRADSTPLDDHDREVLRFALMLEELQVAFYTEAVRAGNLTGEPRQFAEVVGAQERAHLQYLRKALGGPKGSSPRFAFGDAFHDNKSFVTAAVTLEDTGLAAYNGQAENVTRSTLRSVARVMSVEARHAAWARAMAGMVPAPHAADVPISAAQALKAVQPFLVKS